MGSKVTTSNSRPMGIEVPIPNANVTAGPRVTGRPKSSFEDFSITIFTSAIWKPGKVMPYYLCSNKQIARMIPCEVFSNLQDKEPANGRKFLVNAAGEVAKLGEEAFVNLSQSYQQVAGELKGMI